MSTIKILLVGFQKYDHNMYPHLRDTIDLLSKICNVEYFFFRERGYFLQSFVKRPFSPLSYKGIAEAGLFTAIDSLKLFSDKNKYDYVIATDEYIYAIVSLIRRNERIILWSHDIIYEDNDLYNTRVVRRVHAICKKALVKNRKLIVQDSDRKELLLKALSIEKSEPEIFYYPVSLKTPDFTASPGRKPCEKPRVMQCGGIGAFRSSDKILSHYQTDHQYYQLLFHGFVSDDFQESIRESRIKPLLSTTIINSTQVFQIIDYCDIGIVSYEQKELNFFYMKNAAGQFVEFLRMGKPVIVMGENNLKQFVETNRIGLGINTVAELSGALGYITARYKEYSENCTNCFTKHYNCETYIEELAEWLSNSSKHYEKID